MIVARLICLEKGVFLAWNTSPTNIVEGGRVVLEVSSFKGRVMFWRFVVFQVSSGRRVALVIVQKRMSKSPIKNNCFPSNGATSPKRNSFATTGIWVSTHPFPRTKY